MCVCPVFINTSPLFLFKILSSAVVKLIMAISPEEILKKFERLSEMDFVTKGFILVSHCWLA